MKNVYLLFPQKIGTIAPEIYGHFSEHIGGVFYDGLWVGKDSPIPNIRGFRKDLIEKLRAIHPAVLRWPGGCFAETYYWRDGIGENRPVRLSWWTPYDKRYESNAVGTHEFLDLCELIGAKPYFAANMTTSTPMQIRDWMDYCLSPRGSTTLALEREKNGHPEPWNIPFWGVGNENWGGGGNMRPGYYADEYRRFATIMDNVSANTELYACGSNADDFSWTHGVTENLANSWARVNGFAMHYYTSRTGDAVNFTDEEWDEMITKAKKMEDIILRNWNIICAHGMEKKMPLIVDEWGCWHPDGSGPSKGYNLFEQQSTMRDAVVAALTLNIFNRHCDKVRMANVAQLVNNLHCLFLAGDQNCITTPTYHVFDMFQDHQGAQSLGTLIHDDGNGAEISVSASIKDKRVLITLANLSCTQDAEIQLSTVGTQLSEQARLQMLTAADVRDHNTFENPDAVTVQTSFMDPRDSFTLPKGSVASVSYIY